MLVASRVPQTPSRSRSPGIGGVIGSEPVATMTCSAVWRTPSTSTTPVPASLPLPRSTSMPRLVSHFAALASDQFETMKSRHASAAVDVDLGGARPRCARRSPPRPAAAATWTECRPSRSTRRRPARARPRRRAGRAPAAPRRSARRARRRRRRSRRSRSRSRRQLRPGLLGHHVRWRTSRASSHRRGRCASHARRARPTRAASRSARSACDANDVSAASTRPGSRVVISCSSQVLPSGSLNVAKEP